MSDEKKIVIPPELLHLVEKREESDRRSEGRREKSDRRVDDLGPLGAAESADDIIELSSEERRSGKDRREENDRRTGNRRGS